MNVPAALDMLGLLDFVASLELLEGGPGGSEGGGEPDGRRSDLVSLEPLLSSSVW